MRLRKKDGLSFVYRTDHEVVVVKPAGVASELTSDPKGVSLIARVRREPGCAGAKLPHRLDRVTRGLVVVALDDKAVAHHNAEILERAWSKWYIARVPIGRGVGGLIGEKRMHVKQVREGGRMRSRVVRAGGQQAVLVVEEVAAAPGRRGEAHALIRLVTGRFHQVRVMMGELGAPLIGDALYGGRSGSFYLEHALVRFRPYGAAGAVTVFEARDADRERVDRSILARLEREARGGDGG